MRVSWLLPLLAQRLPCFVCTRIEPRTSFSSAQPRVTTTFIFKTSFILCYFSEAAFSSNAAHLWVKAPEHLRSAQTLSCLDQALKPTLFNDEPVERI